VMPAHRMAVASSTVVAHIAADAMVAARTDARSLSHIRSRGDDHYIHHTVHW
jgi:hypothetical protein